MNEPKIKKNRPKTRRRGGTFNKTLTVSALLVLVIVIAAFTPYFRIKNIIVEGNTHIDDEYISRVSGVSRGMNTFSIKLSEVKNNLLSEPYIYDVKIKRVFPNDIKIVISESNPVAVVPYADGRFVLIDEHGIILEKTTVENGEYPEITGVMIDVTEGMDIKPADEDNEERVGIIPEILKQLLSCGVRDRVVEINIADTDNIRFILNNGKMEARLCGIDQFDYKLKMLTAIIEVLDEEHKTEGIIDFSGDDPVYRPSDILTEPEEEKE